MNQQWVGRRIKRRLAAAYRRLAAKVRCYVMGHEWIEVKTGETFVQGFAQCTKCGKEAPMVFKHTIGGPEYPIEDEKDEQ
jgi:hypothetical protein